MKGYKPKLVCRHSIETSNNQTNSLLELGAASLQCDCKDGCCKNKNKK